MLFRSAIGSGFTLYHRSVFDTVPYPWFQFAPRGVPKPELESVLRDFSGDRTFPDFLESLADGDRFISPEEKETIRNKAMTLRRALGQSRSPLPFGPDYLLCVNAQHYGIKTYVHFGVPVMHYNFEPINHGLYIHYNRDPHNWWSEAMNGRADTVQAIQELKKQAEGLEFIRKMDVDQLEADYAEGRGKKVETGS